MPINRVDTDSKRHCALLHYLGFPDIKKYYKQIYIIMEKENNLQIPTIYQ